MEIYEIGEKVVWNDNEWTVEDIEMCNTIGVNLKYKEGGRINYHLIRNDEKHIRRARMPHHLVSKMN